MSVSSSISSEDQFDFLRGNNGGDVEVSLATTGRQKPQPSSATAKTPQMKTPTMEALTRKYEFLLDEDNKNNSSKNDDTPGGDSSYFRTPPPSSSKLQSRPSSRQSSCSGTPTQIVKPILSAQKILNRLNNSADDINNRGPPRMPSASPSWEQEQEQEQQQRQPQHNRSRKDSTSSSDRYTTTSPHLKQNLEKRLKMLEEKPSKSPVPVPALASAQQQLLQTPPRLPQQKQRGRRLQQSPLMRSFGFPARGEASTPDTTKTTKTEKIPSPLTHSRVEKRQLKKPQHHFRQQQRETPSASRQSHQQQSSGKNNYGGEEDTSPRFVTSSTNTASTLAMSEATTGIIALPDGDQEYYGEEEKKGETFDGHPIATTRKEDSASFWHRWKLAEKRMIQQQDQFEREKLEWVRQLESAHDANSKIDALRKRMEVQLLAVHKTCFQHEGDELDEAEEQEILPPQEAPINPLHLLMLRDSATLPENTNVEDVNIPSEGSDENDNNSITQMDSFEYTDRLERRMARTKTKNCILTHLVKLLERQAEEQKRELEERLKLEKEERHDLMKELSNLERQVEERANTNDESKKISESKLMSPQPSEKDQTKALQNRLWMREQQYEQERKEFDAKIKSLRAENDRMKQQVEQQLQKPIPRKQLKPPQSLLEKRVHALEIQLENVKSSKQEIQSKYDTLQTTCDELRSKAEDNEREQRRKDVKQMQELTRLENQLSKAQKEAQSANSNYDTKQANQKIKELEAKVIRLEAKHGREKKELELKLLQKGRRMGLASPTHNKSRSDTELTKKQQEKERARLEGELQEARSDVERFQQESKDALVQQQELQSLVENLQERLDTLEGEKVERGDAEASAESRLRDLEERYENEKQEWMEQLGTVKGESSAKTKQIADLQSWLDESKEDYAQLQKILGEKKKNTKQAEDEQQGFIRQLEEETTKLEFSLQVERENLANAENKNASLERQFQQLRRDHANEIHRMDERMQELIEAEQAGRRLSSLALDQELMKEKYEDLDQQLSEVTKELEGEKERSGEVTKELETCLESLEAESSKYSKLKEINDQVTKELEAAVQNLETERDACAEAESQLEDSFKKREAIEVELRQATSQCNELEEQNSELNKQLQQLNDRFINEMKDLEARTNESRAARSDLSERNATLEALLNESKEAQVELRAKADSLEQCVQELHRQKDAETSRASELEESNLMLNGELHQLNDRFINEMKEMEERYQMLLSESNLSKEKNSRLQEQTVEMSLELEKKGELLRIASTCNKTPSEESSHGRKSPQDPCASIDPEKSNSQDMGAEDRGSLTPRLDGVTNEQLEAQVEQLEKEISASRYELKRATEQSNHFESEVGRLTEVHNQAMLELTQAIEQKNHFETELAKVTDEYDKEKLEWESQREQLRTCESNDSARTQELIEQKESLMEEKEERERQLEEAKKEVEEGLRKLSAQSDEYRAAVKMNAKLDSEAKALRLEKKDWQLKLQSLSMANKNLEERMNSMQAKHDQALKDWNLARDQNQKEISQMQQRYDDILAEKHALQSQVVASERQIDTMSNLHEAEKHDWQEHARKASEQAVTSYTGAFHELKQEVFKMGEQIAVSNQTIKELTNKRSLEQDVLTGFNQIQLNLSETAKRIAQEAQDSGVNSTAISRRLDDIEKVLSQQQEALREQVKEQVKRISKRSNEVEVSGLREKSLEDLRRYEADLACAKCEIQKLSENLATQKSRREAAEKESSLLREQLDQFKKDDSPPSVVEIQCSNEHEDRHTELQLEDENDVLLEMGNLDSQLADLSAKIEDEMEEIRCLCSSVESSSPIDTADDSEEVAGARQAMFAQTLLLVQSLRHLLVNSEVEEEEEDQTSAVMQHLEILSELMGQVDELETTPSSEDDVNQQLAHKVEAALVPKRAHGEAAETDDLLQFELEQDDSIDLLHDVSQDQTALRITSSAPDSSVVYEEHPVLQEDPLDDRSNTDSPIQLYVEQNFQRCQQLERERCELINTTLDLLSASREANKAELDAALATARRKASEEMIAMKQQCSNQVEQIWSRLCDKCRQGLVQG